MKKIFYLILLLSIFVFYGCGDNNLFEGSADKNSSEAQKVELKNDLDDGNYDSVINELENQDNLDQEERILLASAYLGKAGVDFINALEISEQSNISSFDTMSEILNSPTLDNNSIKTKNNLINKALTTLDPNYESATLASYETKTLYSTTPERKLNVTNPSEDEDLLKGIAATMDTLVIIGDILYNVTGEPVKLTKNYINGLFPQYESDLTSYNIPDTTLTRINKNLAALNTAIYILAGENFDNIRADFEDFKNKLGYSDSQITENEIENYILNLN
ncbi:hypothetical protein [Flexistipes sinusarabici]|uniref:hypothetical protein n=1 Tax=Flexistipes sinusarabici TaxID=2352 RepID=UPI00235286B6|nr:hypothetical protein [Flexistipes sinusarabici]